MAGLLLPLHAGRCGSHVLPGGRLPTMGPWLPALLCLGLCLGQENKALNDALPKPLIIFENGSVVPVGRPVSVRCRGPPEAQLFFLKKEQEVFVGTERPIWNEGHFSFPTMERAMVGVYSCAYQVGSSHSPPSDSMNLAVSGVLPKPFLSASPSTQLVSGQSLSFKCWSEHKLDRLIVYQDKGLILPTFGLAQNSVTELRFSRINSKYTGTFFCMGFASKEPLLWSMPSDPVELTVSQSQDHAVDIVVLVIPLALGTLLS